MKRVTAATTRIDPNVRCLRVYPTAETKRNIDDLVTVGFKLSKSQAIHLARVILALSQDSTEIDITAYRKSARSSDKTYKVTVTSAVTD